MTTATETTTSVSAQGDMAGGSHAGMSRPAVIAELEKILSSGTFVRSKRLGRFLRFTVEQCLEGRQNSLKEYLVGVEVFNKLESFDPRIDSIVRVEARRLRSKLERYYQTEGVDDEVVIQFRKGSYVPQLMTKEQHRQSEEGGGRTAARSVTVGRFANLGVDPAWTHFCSGLTDDIISALTKVPGFRVLSRTTTGDDNRGDYVVEGSVRQQGTRMRIAAQLIHCASETYVWSETYERDLSDVFALQDEISRAIVVALRRESPPVRMNQ